MKLEIRALLILSLARRCSEPDPLLERAEDARLDSGPHAEQTAFLEKVVNINSGTLNLAGVKAVGDEFANEFKALGFETRWIPLPAEMNRAGHLFAEHKAKKQSRNPARRFY